MHFWIGVQVNALCGNEGVGDQKEDEGKMPMCAEGCAGL